MVSSSNVKRSQAAENRLTTDHARFNRGIAMPNDLFTPRYDMPGGARPKWGATIFIGDASVTVRSYDALDGYDAKTLATITAMAGTNGLTLEPEPEAEIGRLTRALLDPDGTNRAAAVYVMTTPTAFLREMGVGRGQNSLKALTASLVRLSTVTFHTVVDDEDESTHLMSYHKNEREGRDSMCVALNPILADAITGGQHVRLDMDEIRAIKGDTAMLLYLRLCALVDWPSGRRTKKRDGLSNSRCFKLDTLASYIWPNIADNESTASMRNTRVRKALEKLAGLPHWTVVEYVANKFKITRHRLPKAGSGV